MGRFKGLVGLAIAALVASTSQAQVGVGSIVVDTAADDILTRGPNGNCSLREAIQAANTDLAVDGCAAGAGDDVITFDPALAGSTILLNSNDETCPGIGADDDNTCGDLDISSDTPSSLSIVGPVDGDDTSIIIDGGALQAPGANGAVLVDCSSADRVLHTVNNVTSLSLSNLTIRNGCPLLDPQQGVTAIRGGGIWAASPGLQSLSLQDVLVANNTVDIAQQFVPGSGGGIATTALNVSLTSVIVDNSLILGENVSEVRGAGMDIYAADSLERNVSIVDTDFDVNFVDVYPASGGINIYGGGLAIGAGMEAQVPFNISINNSEFETNGIILCNPDRPAAGGSFGCDVSFSTLQGGALSVNNPGSITNISADDLLVAGSSIETFEDPLGSNFGLQLRGAGVGLNTAEMNLSMSNSDLLANSITTSLGFARGGALYSNFDFGNIDLDGTIISGNSATSDSGLASGGGVWLASDSGAATPSSILLRSGRVEGNLANANDAFSGAGAGVRILLGNLEVPGAPFSVQLDDMLFTGNGLSTAGTAIGGSLAIEAYNLVDLSLVGNEFSDSLASGSQGGSGGGVAMVLESVSEFSTTLNGNQILNNSVSAGNGVATGGGLNMRARNIGTLNMQGNNFSENTVDSSLEEAGGGGAAFFMTNLASIAINSSDNRFNRNSVSGIGAVLGGGLYLQVEGLGVANVTGSQFMENSLFQQGELTGGETSGGGAVIGVAFSDSFVNPRVEVSASEFSDNDIQNFAGDDGEGGTPLALGGGLLAGIADGFDGLQLGVDFGSPGCPGETPCIFLRNTTISGNVGDVPGGDAIGGGLAFDQAVSASLNNLTLVNNSVTGNNAFGGGLGALSAAETQTSNSIIALNSASSQGNDCFAFMGTIQSLDYNLIGEADTCGFVAAANDQVGDSDGVLDPELNPLSFVGDALTRVHLPFSSSPVLDNANPNTPTGEGGSCEPDDQIGNTRPEASGVEAPFVCDIGAVELVGNQPPSIINPIEDQTLDLQGPGFSINLNEVFEDPEGSTLFFNAFANDSSVAVASVDGDTLVVTAVGPGTTTVDVTAFDDFEADTTDSFQVVVLDPNRNQPPAIISSIPDQVLPVRGDNTAFDLNTVFSDPEGDDLFFEAITSNSDVVTVEIDGSIMTLIPGDAGTAVVTVTAFDTAGQSANIRVKSLAGSGGPTGSASGGGQGSALGSSGGGGCALSSNEPARVDPLLWLLALLAGGMVARRRMNR